MTVESVMEERAREGEWQLQQEPLSLCPMCNLHTGRRIRNKVYCVNVAISSHDMTVVNLPAEDVV